MMRVRRVPDVQTFLAEAGSFLGDREAEHNLLFGICSQLVSNPSTGDPAYFAVCEDGERLVGAAVRTPPHNLVLSRFEDPGAIEPLIGDVRGAVGTIPGVLGPKAVAAAFARSWSERVGATASLSLAERIYQASSARIPGEVAGTFRPYRDGDHDLTVRWFEAFVEEALPDELPQEASDEVLTRRLADPDGGLRFWEKDGKPVSLAGFGSKTPNGIRVGPVYTPPELRGHGYASALVGRMTAELLDGGHRYCFLFTDLSNGTSNGIYQRIGYEPVSDVDVYAFS